MANYNLTNLTEANTLLEYGIAVNGVTGEAFFLLMTVVIYAITFISMKNFDTGTAFMSSSFIVTFLSMILWSVGLLSETVLIAYFSLTLISVFLKKMID